MYCDYLEPTSTITKNNTISRFDSSNKYVLQQRLNRRCYRRELSTVGTAYHQPYHLILQDGAQIRYYNPFTLLSLTCVISRAAIDRILYGMILYIYDCHYTKLIIIFGVAFGVLRLPFLHFLSLDQLSIRSETTFSLSILPISRFTLVCVCNLNFYSICDRQCLRTQWR